jgi:magnesium-transporting ATPase (P-type)
MAMMSDTSPDTPTPDVDNAQVNAVTPDSKAEGKESPDRMTADKENGQDDTVAKQDAPTADEDDSAACSVTKDDNLQLMEEGEAITDKTKRAEEVGSPVARERPSLERPIAAPMSSWNPRKRWMVISLCILAVCVIGALIITVISIVRNSLSQAEVALLITFAVLAICVVPISCYAGLTCTATDGYFD